MFIIFAVTARFSSTGVASVSAALATSATQTSGPGLLLPGSDARHHALVTPAPAKITATPGAKVSLFVDVVPKPGIHVYAPGAEDYTPITIKLVPGADITPGKLAYPKSEILFFEPLNERVPIFQKPFRLTQEVAVGRSVKPGSTLTVDGTVSYQACDDKVCYVPESIPVSWTVNVK
ncbi:MAG TPA: protein-disulfide reductase DsbD domain-containing protein [Vicinamibacterales bacterium]|nr:protein-disulfide reductase DsbD domain-containing protein [Vicinamibacterales bacterium]